MSLRQRYVTILAHLAPAAGAVGLSAALGAVAPAAASEPPGGNPPAATNEGVSERLAAVRDAVSAVDQLRADAAKAEGRLAWGNFGWGWGYNPWYRPWNNWHNWNNWGNWFHNW